MSTSRRVALLARKPEQQTPLPLSHRDAIRIALDNLWVLTSILETYLRSSPTPFQKKVEMSKRKSDEMASSETMFPGVAFITGAAGSGKSQLEYFATIQTASHARH